MWTNAAQAKKVPGRAQGDGKQPVAKFSKPEPPRAPTADPVSATPDTGQSQDNQDSAAPQVEITHDGSSFVVTAKFASEDEAHQAAQALQGQDADMNPSQAMM